MKKVAFMAVLAVATAGFAATPVTFKDGNYTGTIKSVSAGLNGKKATLTAKTAGDTTTLTFKLDGDAGREEWVIAGNKLVQTEYDAANKPTAKYSATLTKSGTNEATFAVDCTDRAKNVCDNNIPGNVTWTLKTVDGQAWYIVNGPQDKTVANSPVVERHNMAFTFAN
ncbi:MAG: hypothetical protein HY465_04260 [Deltaproteobacteria bacterium]|nr:hypothetical protein [Deltaproteobacteria bacterium]